MKKFVKFSKIKELKKTELQNIKGGMNPLYGIQPLYGIKPLYGVTPLYGVVVVEEE